MKKVFENPEMNISVFAVEDVVTTSTTVEGGGSDTCPYETSED